MDLEKTSFVAIYPNGNFVRKETLAEIKELVAFDFILRLDFKFRNTTSFNDYIYYYYTIIDINNKKTTFRKGNFEVVDIGYESTELFHHSMNYKIFDHVNNELIDYNIKYKGLELFKDILFPLLEKLNEFGSWKSYQLLLELETLKNKNKQLELENKNLVQSVSTPKIETG